MNHTIMKTTGLVVLALAGASCSKDAPTPTAKAEPAACCLDALSDTDRAREQELLREHVAAVQEVREVPDGYAYRLPPDAPRFTRTAELITLERGCCPFLTFRLEWASDGAPWLHVTGGPEAKEFIGTTFGPPAKQR